MKVTPFWERERGRGEGERAGRGREGGENGGQEPGARSQEPEVR